MAKTRVDCCEKRRTAGRNSQHILAVADFAPSAAEDPDNILPPKNEVEGGVRAEEACCFCSGSRLLLLAKVHPSLLEMMSAHRQARGSGA